MLGVSAASSTEVLPTLLPTFLFSTSFQTKRSPLRCASLSPARACARPAALLSLACRCLASRAACTLKHATRRICRAPLDARANGGERSAAGASPEVPAGDTPLARRGCAVYQRLALAPPPPTSRPPWTFHARGAPPWGPSWGRARERSQRRREARLRGEEGLARVWGAFLPPAVVEEERV